MGFLLKICIVTALVLGGGYYLLRDTPLLSKVLGGGITVQAEETVPEIFIRLIQAEKEQYKTTDASTLVTLFREAVALKYAAMLAADAAIDPSLAPDAELSYERFMQTGRAEFVKLVRGSADADKSGDLERSEWHEAHAFIYAAHDTNRDSIISKDEMETWADDSNRRAFRRADRDKNDTLSEQEYFSTLGSARAAQDAAIQVDANKNGEVTTEELQSYQYSTMVFNP